MTAPSSLPATSTPGGFGGIVDTLGKLAKVPGIDKLSGLLSGASLPIGGSSATSTATATSGLNGDVNIAGIGSQAGTGGQSVFIWLAVAVVGSIFVWKKFK